MKKQAFAFHMQNYRVQGAQLKNLPCYLVLSKPKGFDLTRFFPKEWHYRSYQDAQRSLPKICPDELLIKTAQRNAECRQLTFVQNFFRQGIEAQKNTKNAKEFAQDLRKNISISTLSNLLFSNFEIYVLKCGCMEGFSAAKKEEITLESWLKANTKDFLDLEISEATERFLSPYETNFIGYLVIPRNPDSINISLQALRTEISLINEYHKKNFFFSTHFE